MFFDTSLEHGLYFVTEPTITQIRSFEGEYEVFTIYNCFTLCDKQNTSLNFRGNYLYYTSFLRSHFNLESIFYPTSFEFLQPEYNLPVDELRFESELLLTDN